MLASLLIILFGGRSCNAVNDLLLGVNEEILFGDDAAAAETELLSLFQVADLDKNDLLSYDEFAADIVTLYRYGDAFDLIDINEDGKLEYDELVHDYKQIMTSNPAALYDNIDATENELKAGVADIVPDGTESNDETMAEVLANTLLFEIDINNKGYIEKPEFIEYEIKDQWASLKEGATGDEISFDIFKNNFYGSSDFKMLDGVYQESDANAFNYIQEIQTSHSNSAVILAAVDQELVFEAHQFDEELSSALVPEFGRRRLIDPITAMMLAYFAAGALKLIAIALINIAGEGGCYDQYELVYALNQGPVYMKDLSVGDYVYDGNDYTKIYFMQQYDPSYGINMLEILYGNPNDENSITLTPHHLLYYADGYEPVMSRDIRIGDLLSGNNDGYNYTVYDIKNVYNKHPINPITASGTLMVNNIKTSVFSHSASEAKRLHECGKIFSWISDNINEDLAANLIEFYYNIIYSRIIRQNHYIYQLVVDNQTFATTVILAVPALIAMFAIKTSKKL